MGEEAEWLAEYEYIGSMQEVEDYAKVRPLKEGESLHLDALSQDRYGDWIYGVKVCKTTGKEG